MYPSIVFVLVVEFVFEHLFHLIRHFHTLKGCVDWINGLRTSNYIKIYNSFFFIVFWVFTFNFSVCFWLIFQTRKQSFSVTDDDRSTLKKKKKGKKRRAFVFQCDVVGVKSRSILRFENFALSFGRSSSATLLVSSFIIYLPECLKQRLDFSKWNAFKFSLHAVEIGRAITEQHFIRTRQALTCSAERGQSTPVGRLKDSALNSLKIAQKVEHLKKTGGYNVRNEIQLIFENDCSNNRFENHLDWID